MVEVLNTDIWTTLFPRLHAAEVFPAVLSLGCPWGGGDIALEDMRLRARPLLFLGHSEAVVGCAFSPSGVSSYAGLHNGPLLCCSFFYCHRKVPLKHWPSSLCLRCTFPV